MATTAYISKNYALENVDYGLGDIRIRKNKMETHNWQFVKQKGWAIM
jgi:hypothetical protein